MALRPALRPGMELYPHLLAPLFYPGAAVHLLTAHGPQPRRPVSARDCQRGCCAPHGMWDVCLWGGVRSWAAASAAGHRA